MTLAAAWPAMISRAMLGPVRAATGWPGTSSAMTSVIRSSDPCSRPLARLTIGIHGWIHSLAVASVERIAVVGTPTMSSSAWRIAFSRSSVAISLSGSVNPGRYASLVWSASISAAVSRAAGPEHRRVPWRDQRRHRRPPRPRPEHRHLHGAHRTTDAVTRVSLADSRS